MTDSPTAIRDAVMGDHRRYAAVEAAAKAFLASIDAAAIDAGQRLATKRAFSAASLDLLEHFLDKSIAEDPEAG